MVAEPTERVPAAVEVAAMAGNYRDVAVAREARVLADKTWAGGSEEEAVVVEELSGLVGECHLVSQQQEAVDHSLGAADVLQEVQLVRWEKQVKQPGEHQQAEAYPQGKPREGAVAGVAYQRMVAAHNVAVGLASREVEAQHQGVGARPPVANLLFGLTFENRQVAALVGLGLPQPCSVHD